MIVNITELRKLVENRGYTLWESEYKSDNL